MKRIFGRCLRRIMIVATLALGCGLAFFLALPLLLIGPAQTTLAEVIVHCAIASHSDADEFIARLYHQKLARKIVCVSTQLSWEVYPADFARQHLIALGVPAEDVLTLHLPPEECRAENLPRVTAYLKSQGWRSALLVLNPAESRFGGWQARRYFSRAEITLAVTYSPRDHAELVSGWWRTHWKAQEIIREALNAALDSIYSECW